jgi:hypothetical protein
LPTLSSVGADCCSDCYRVERTSSRVGIPSLWTSAFHGAPGYPTCYDVAILGRSSVGVTIKEGDASAAF